MNVPEVGGTMPLICGRNPVKEKDDGWGSRRGEVRVEKDDRWGSRGGEVRVCLCVEEEMLCARVAYQHARVAPRR